MVTSTKKYYWSGKVAPEGKYAWSGASPTPTPTVPSPTPAAPTVPTTTQPLRPETWAQAGERVGLYPARERDITLIEPFKVSPTVSTRTTALEGPSAREFYKEKEIPYKELVPLEYEAKVVGQSLRYLPQQIGASVLQAWQGEAGPSVVDRDWADKYVAEANEDLDSFVGDIMRQYPSSSHLHELAQLSRNLAFSVTTMGTGTLAALPLWLAPEPTGGTKLAAMTTTGVVSGFMAYRMTTYQIVQEYLEFKNAESIEQTGRGITLEEENKLKADFHSDAVKYGLWEAVPEGISNFLFSGILTGGFNSALTKVVGRDAAKAITGSFAPNVATKLVGMYGEELLTETITQKGQSAIEVEAGLREGRISWVEAFKEIFPQTMLLTTIMAGSGQVIISSPQAIQRIKNSFQKEATEKGISEGTLLYDEINKGIETDIESVTIAPETITGVEPTITEAPTVAMAEGEAGTGFEGLETTTEGEAATEVAGVPPKPPTNWDKVGGDLYNNYKRQSTPQPTPNTMPASDRLRRAWGVVKRYVADEFARLDELGWQAEQDVHMVRAADGKSAQLYRQTMEVVSTSLNRDSNLLSYTNDYLTLRHQLEVLKATGRKYFSVKSGTKTTRFTARQMGLMFAQMKKELGAANYARVKEAASHFPAVYNQILRENQELTPGQIEGLIKKYPWFNPIVFKHETSPINIASKMSPRQVKQLTTWEVDTEMLTPLEALPITIGRRMKAQAINKARRSVAELAVDPENKTLVGGDVEIVFKKPEGAFIDFYDEGQHRYLRLGKGAEWIAKDIDLLQRQPPNMLIKGVRSLQNLSKMFFTTYNPGFVAWNTAFDAITAYFAEGISPYGFGKALAGNIEAMFREVPAVSEFRRAGAEQFGFFMKGAEIGKEGEITPFISKRGGQLRLKNPESLKRFLNPFALIRELGIAGENAARRATFEKAKKDGLSDDEAALRARRVTVDFSRFSIASRHINDWYIYFNPALQGFFLPGRAIRKDKRSLWRLSAIVMGYVGLTLYNMSYDEYDDVRDSDKVGKFLVMLPSDEYNKYGQKVPHYLTLLPWREFALFTAPIEYLIGRLKTEEPEAYRSLAQEWDVLYPVISPLSMISETGGLVFPTQIGATIQQIVNNHDDFRDRDIVDDEMELLPPSEQYDQYTNGLAIKIGQALDISPKKLDFFISNMFGGLGNDLLREVNRAIETIDNKDVDERIANLVKELREIPMTTPPNQIEVAREAFLEGLDVADRDLVLNMENLPDDEIPFVQSIFRRFFRDYGGQVYATAKERALMDRTLEDYPPEALEKLQKDANENANNLLNGKITKKQYDDNRSRYRAYYSGGSTAQWREGMTEGAVARSDVDRYMPEAYQRSEEFQAVSAYMEIRQKYIDEAGGVFDSDAWDRIEEQTLIDLRKDYSESAIQYAIAHKDDWIDNLPEPARTVERQRAIALENETWWDDYRGTTEEGKYAWSGRTAEETPSTPSKKYYWTK